MLGFKPSINSISEILEKFKLLLKVSRPVLWLWVIFPFVAGLAISDTRFTPLIWLEIIALGPVYGVLLYGINDVYDYESDKLNNRKDSPHGEVLEPENHNFVLKSGAVSASILLLISLLTENMWNILGVSALIIFAVGYSAPPLRLKSRAPLDSVVNGLGYVLIPGIMGFSFGASVSNLPVEAYWVALATFGLHPATTAMDYKSDKESGCQTFAVRFGRRKALLFSLATVGFVLLFSPIDLLIANALILQLFLIVGLMTADEYDYFELTPEALEKLIFLVYMEGTVLGVYYLFGSGFPILNI